MGELEEAKEGRSASEAEVQRLHAQLLRLEENAEADLARAAEEVMVNLCCANKFGPAYLAKRLGLRSEAAAISRTI